MSPENSSCDTKNEIISGIPIKYHHLSHLNSVILVAFLAEDCLLPKITSFYGAMKAKFRLHFLDQRSNLSNFPKLSGHLPIDSSIIV